MLFNLLFAFCNKKINNNIYSLVKLAGHSFDFDEPKIITVSWKWLGDETIHYLKWDKNHSDEQLMKDFLVEYNKADMVIGYNNDRFDNRFINSIARTIMQLLNLKFSDL